LSLNTVFTLWRWIRALIYMCVIGAGWLIAFPSLLLYWQTGQATPEFRGSLLVGIGVCLFLFGAALALWAGFYLIHKGEGTPFPLDCPRRLVTDGPYRFVRNPQAIAMMLMVMGEVLVVDSLILLFLLPLTLFYLEVLVGPIESRQLARDFGADYKAYAARVPKWLPRRPRHAI
jgi:protein-S-isoprenylcysteine O-methyltransferase Ste14